MTKPLPRSTVCRATGGSVRVKKTLQRVPLLRCESLFIKPLTIDEPIRELSTRLVRFGGGMAGAGKNPVAILKAIRRTHCTWLTGRTSLSWSLSVVRSWFRTRDFPTDETTVQLADRVRPYRMAHTRNSSVSDTMFG